MQTFTNAEALRVLDFFVDSIASTMLQVKGEFADDGAISMTQIRLYDAACLAENYGTLANKYDNSADGEDTVFTFTVDDVQDAISSLDTEFADSVYEWFLEYDDALARKVYGHTYEEMCAKARAAFAI